MLGRITILAALAASLASAQSELPEARFLRVDYTFRDAAIPPSQIRQITAQIEKTSFDAPDSWEQELRIRRVAMGQADVLVVRGTSLLCGATENCQAWVFLRSQQRWRNLIQGPAPLASGLGFEERVSAGLKNLVLVTNAGRQKDRYTRYRFNGQFYRAGDCFDVEPLDSPTGESKVTRVECER
jgi:hypothetical protein